MLSGADANRSLQARHDVGFNFDTQGIIYTVAGALGGMGHVSSPYLTTDRCGKVSLELGSNLFQIIEFDMVDISSSTADWQDWVVFGVDSALAITQIWGAWYQCIEYSAGDYFINNTRFDKLSSPQWRGNFTLANLLDIFGMAWWGWRIYIEYVDNDDLLAFGYFGGAAAASFSTTFINMAINMT